MSETNNPVTPGLVPPGPTPGAPSPAPSVAQSTASISQQPEDTIHTQFEPVFQYIVDDIIRLPQSSVIRHQEEVFEVLDLITMSEADIADITGRVNGNDVRISKRDSRLLLHFVWWHQDLSAQLLNTTLEHDVWFHYD